MYVHKVHTATKTSIIKKHTHTGGACAAKPQITGARAKSPASHLGHLRLPARTKYPQRVNPRERADAMQQQNLPPNACGGRQARTHARTYVRSFAGWLALCIWGDTTMSRFAKVLHAHVFAAVRVRACACVRACAYTHVHVAKAERHGGDNGGGSGGITPIACKYRASVRASASVCTKQGGRNGVLEGTRRNVARLRFDAGVWTVCKWRNAR